MKKNQLPKLEPQAQSLQKSPKELQLQLLQQELQLQLLQQVLLLGPQNLQKHQNKGCCHQENLKDL
ncbi:hypothetical protein RchiOBHm_Chr2g0132131 [Rosa chinensis]|uniref:Uncharacterized protein n=1 Tax=Rosa chinensis TaxID=74649 RepID=A0A2P6RV90_ROSCH|nr:hypothetical protein RchiOBHm_Chr2g0132131 [Rosa chinensis]